VPPGPLGGGLFIGSLEPPPATAMETNPPIVGSRKANNATQTTAILKLLQVLIKPPFG